MICATLLLGRRVMLQRADFPGHGVRCLRLFRSDVYAYFSSTRQSMRLTGLRNPASDHE
jgi:hypothetical protein